MLSILSFGHGIEENMGLKILFSLRGQRQPPHDVIIVSIDKQSSDNLGLPNRPEKWPHELHAQLTDFLSESGARSIAFDIFFNESRSKKDDISFANSMSKANNVILVESIKRKKIPLRDGRGNVTGDLNIERLSPPISPLAESSLALAPFPLPKVPIKVSQFWTFKPETGGAPTLPIVALQVYALEAYDEFFGLLSKFNENLNGRMPANRSELLKSKNIVNVMKQIRDIFENEPFLVEMMLDELNKPGIQHYGPEKKRLVKALIRMYQSPNSTYLNFYGYPRSITTIPFYEVLRARNEQNPGMNRFDFRDKAVFVGSSEKFQPEQKDGFYTVFTQPNGLDISGVEIAATAFANFMEDMPVKPVHFLGHVAFVFVWGMLIGFICRFFPRITTGICVTAAGILYFVFILFKFSSDGIWYPLVIPIFFQVPMGFTGAMIWKYFDTSKERHDIRKAFSYYLPDEVIDKITRNISDVKDNSQVVYGVCLSSDAEQYTSIAETLSPKELSNFMNKYYESLFKPIKHHGGIVSNVIGDAMLAVWVTGQSDIKSRKHACLASLDINEVTNAPYYQSQNLPTRIGLHSGTITLGNIGAEDHYEYRPVGDIVNTTTRIEGLNKYLGTRILLSDEILKDLDGFLTRKLGKFILSGKSQPITLHELVSRKEESSHQQRDICKLFSEALDMYMAQSWEEAMEVFGELAGRPVKDGPSVYYFNVCKKLHEKPPEDGWDGIIYFDKK
jgi:adenylate cyclase